jgi:hypothetical protein
MALQTTSADLRTAKSCGPDTPTLVSDRRRFSADDGGYQARYTGESTKETVKTIVRGKPGVSGEPVVTMLVCFIQFAYEAAGASRTRLSLRPRFSRDEEFIHNSGASRREKAEVCLAVIARSESDEAIQLSIAPRKSWIASLALAMTAFWPGPALYQRPPANLAT